MDLKAWVINSSVVLNMLRGPVPYKVNIQALWLVFSAGNGIDLAGLRKCHYLWL